MSQRGEVERFALEQLQRRAALIEGGVGVIQHVHLFARHDVANGRIAHLVHRAKVAAAEMPEYFVTVFKPVADAMAQKADFG